MANILEDANPLTMRDRCGVNTSACIAGFGMGVLLVLLLILVYYFFFSSKERMVNLAASAYDTNPEALRLAQGIMASDPGLSNIAALQARKERMSENTSDRMAGYLWS